MSKGQVTRGNFTVNQFQTFSAKKSQSHLNINTLFPVNRKATFEQVVL